MFNFTTVVFDGTTPPFFFLQTLRDGTPQVQMIPSGVKLPVKSTDLNKGSDYAHNFFGTG